MTNQDLLKIKKAKYNKEKTTIILQSIFCSIILLAILGLIAIKSECILLIRNSLHEDIDWQIIYEILLYIRDSILKYIG